MNPFEKLWKPVNDQTLLVDMIEQNKRTIVALRQTTVANRYLFED